MGDIKYPVELVDIKKFESLNSIISINVYTYDEIKKSTFFKK